MPLVQLIGINGVEQLAYGAVEVTGETEEEVPVAILSSVFFRVAISSGVISFME